LLRKWGPKTLFNLNNKNDRIGNSLKKEENFNFTSCEISRVSPIRLGLKVNPSQFGPKVESSRSISMVEPSKGRTKLSQVVLGRRSNRVVQDGRSGQVSMSHWSISRAKL